MPKSALFLCALLPFWACGPGTPPAPQPYSNNGFSMLVPAAWQVENDSNDNGMRQVFVAGPNDSVLLMQLLPSDIVLPLTEYAVFYSGTFAASADPGLTVAAGDIDEFERSMRGVPTKGIRESFAISDDELSINYVREFSMFPHGDQTMILIVQGRAMDETQLRADWHTMIESIQLP